MLRSTQKGTEISPLSPTSGSWYVSKTQLLEKLCLCAVKLRSQIMLDRFLCALFGALLNVDEDKLKVIYRANGAEGRTVVERWESIESI